ncbi:uncharacterized protein LOC111079845 [Drosophila obscura]|uniref:uncharacterized protein LOC111079845 n=1 Tax=Drosophila obscura TaxID=7282 RepID=UPI001BB2620E|nr:uncharacterized protein LOC111079845 [Drosophila obscura]
MVRYTLNAVRKCLCCVSLLLILIILCKRDNELIGKNHGDIAGVADKKYYVKTVKCRIPYVDPFGAEIMKYYKPLPFIPCTNESDLIDVQYDTYLNRYVLHINEHVIHGLLHSNDTPYTCFYQQIIHGEQADDYDRIGDRVYFGRDYVVPVSVEGILVECRALNHTRVLQKDAFVFVQHQKAPPVRPQEPRKPSVIMYGIDTVSRTNLRRTMPLVYEFLKSPGWYEMMGYTKVADNSFPNLFAILTGYFPETAKSKLCDTDIKGCLDRIPFIWKDLKKAGYLTAFAEDESDSNTFTYMKPGFTVKPVDYYFRPFVVALENRTKVQLCPGCGMKYCLGRRLANSYIFDYCRQFMQRFVADRPIWGMFWSNHFSHDDSFMPSAMQHKILQDLLNFERDGAFEHTIMIFFSDHGARFGPLQKVPESFLEETLPMMFIHLPPWFRRKYPQHAEALALNQHRLSSNFDLYHTLRHILQIGGATLEASALSKFYDCPTCQSLLLPIPEDRSCAQAAIEETYCTCNAYREVNGEWTRRIAHRVIHRINEYLWQHKLNRLCSNLTLKYVTRTEQKDSRLLHTKMVYYRTKFMVNENDAEFFGTPLFDNATEALDINVERISRINTYKTDSKCMHDKIKKLYCICLTELKT